MAVRTILTLAMAVSMEVTSVRREAFSVVVQVTLADEIFTA